MLVITRRVDEDLLLFNADGDLVRVRVLACSPNLVQLGIDAPARVRVLRAELMRDREVDQSIPA